MRSFRIVALLGLIAVMAVSLAIACGTDDGVLSSAFGDSKQCC